MPPKPRVLNEKEIAEVETLSSVLNQTQVADYFGISQDTFQRICTRQPDVMRSYKLGKAKAIKDVGSSLLQKARDGDAARQMFYLKTQAGWREKEDTAIVAAELMNHIIGFGKKNA